MTYAHTLLHMRMHAHSAMCDTGNPISVCAWLLSIMYGGSMRMSVKIGVWGRARARRGVQGHAHAGGSTEQARQRHHPASKD